MATFLFEEHIFGPIKSRRLGSSLGINLLSTKQKVCNFDCVYCECGSLKAYEEHEALYVDEQLLIQELEERLSNCKTEGTHIDVITFAGNGEPTLHPSFDSIIDHVIKLRQKYFPSAKIAVLTNGVTLKNDKTSAALKRIDKPIIKLDAGTDNTIQLIDRPKKTIHINEIIHDFHQFNAPFIVQTMFLKGLVDGVEFDNSSDLDVKKWLHCIEMIKPIEVMIYSLDRDTPIDTLSSISKERLHEIAKKVNRLGIKTQVV